MVNSLVNDTCYNTVEAKSGKYGTSAFSLGFHNKQFWSFNGFLDNIWVIQTPQACKALPQFRNILFVVKKPALTKRIKKLLDYWFYNHSSATKYYHSSATKYYHKRNLLRVQMGDNARGWSSQEDHHHVFGSGHIILFLMATWLEDKRITNFAGKPKKNKIPDHECRLKPMAIYNVSNWNVIHVQSSFSVLLPRLKTEFVTIRMTQ